MMDKYTIQPSNRLNDTLNYDFEIASNDPVEVAGSMASLMSAFARHSELASDRCGAILCR